MNNLSRPVAGRGLATRLKKNLATYVALSLLIVAVGCTASQFRQAAVLMRDFSLSLETFQKGEIATYQAGFIPKDDHLFIQDGIEKVAGYGKEANQAIRIAKSKGDAMAKIDAAIQELDAMLKRGQLGIKNDEKKATYAALLLAVRAVLISAKAALT